MSDVTLKRIMDLETQSDVDNSVYTIIDSPTGYGKKYPLGSFIASVAPIFDSTAAYTAGSYCNYNGQIYRFTADHAAGSWTGSDVTAVNVGGELSDLKQDFSKYNTEVLGLYPQMQIEDTAVASFADGADDIPVKSLTVDVTPVQDMHGQANPYPPGGGKNLLNNTASTTTKKGVTFTVNSDGTVIVNGTATDDVELVLTTNAVETEGNYTVNGCPSSGSSSTYWLNFKTTASGASTWRQEYGSGLTVTGVTIQNVGIYVKQGATANNVLFKPMIRLASVSDATFAPYSNICPISGWTGANVSVFDVNLWDEEWELGAINNSGVKTVSTTNFRSKNYISVQPNATYTIYYGSYTASTILYYYFYDSNKEYVGVSDYIGGTYRSFTVPSNACYMLFRTGGSSPQNSYNHDISINYPSTDHDYHAYKGNVYSISFPTAAGTVYGGTLDVTSGVLTVTNGYADLGTLNWTYGNNQVFYTTVPKKPGLLSPMMCSEYLFYVGGYGDAPDKSISGNSIYNFIYVKDSAYTDAATFQTAVSGVQLVYELATPVTYQLTPTEVATILGQNSIFADTGDIAELTYRADLKAYIDAHVGS